MALSTGTVVGLLVGTAVVGGVAWYFTQPQPYPAFVPRPAPRLTPRSGKGSVAISGSPEALRWLNQNANPQGFASNQFSSIESAHDFVQRLYDRGAVKVRVGGIRGEDWRIEAEGGPYADTLFVTLPANSAKRADVLRVLQAREPSEMRPYGGKKNVLRVWWD
jgi:hypothetical protein